MLDSDLGADEPWLATAYVPGPSLRDAVIAGGPLTVDATLRLVAGVAEALQEVHAAGVTHCDLKPTNVILTADGPRITDTGISPAGQLSSPESDVAAVGHLAVFAATGWQGGIEHCPEPVRTIAAACAADDPRQRPTPAEIIQRCQAVASGSPPAPAPGSITPPSVPPTAAPPRGARAPRRLSRRWVLRTVGLLVVGAARHRGCHRHPAAWRVESERGRAVQRRANLPTGRHPDRPHAQRQRPGVRPGRHADLRWLGRHHPIVGRRQPPAALRDRHQPGRQGRHRPEDGRQLVGHTGDVTAVAFSPDGQTLAAAGMDNVVRLWNTTSQQHTGIIRNGATEGSAALAFSPDGALLATSDNTGQVWLWDMAQQHEITNLPRTRRLGGRPGVQPGRPAAGRLRRERARVGRD